jgi:hypothetical protein
VAGSQGELFDFGIALYFFGLLPTESNLYFQMAQRINISRSGNMRLAHEPITRNIPDREIPLANSRVVAVNFPNGKSRKS